MITPIPLSTHAAHHGGFIDTILRGFGWGLGRDAEHAIFQLIPTGLVIVLVIAAAAYMLRRWAKHR